MPNMDDFKHLMPATKLGTKLVLAFMGAAIGGSLGGMVALEAAKANSPSAADVKVARSAVTQLRQLATAAQPQPLASVTNPVARFVLSECQAQFATSANHQHINICLINKAEDFSRVVLKPLEVKPAGQGAALAKGMSFGGVAGTALALLALRRRKPAPSAGS